MHAALKYLGALSGCAALAFSFVAVAASVETSQDKYNVKVPGGGAAEAKLPDVELSHETEEMFRWLRRQCPLSPAMEKHLLGFAKMMGMP